MNKAALGILTVPLLFACSGDPEVNVIKECQECDTYIWVDEDPDIFDWDSVLTVDSLDPLASCLPDNNGVIEQSEMPAVVGAVASTRVNGPGKTIQVNPAGEQIDGKQVWDFRNNDGTYARSLRVENPEDFWFADEFENAQYASAVSLWDDSVLAIYRNGPGTVQMLGIASRTRDGSMYTLAKYDPPVELFRFPIQLGSAWESTVEFKNAILQGVLNAGEEEYRLTVDGRGTLMLPQFTLENTLRIRLELRQTFVVSSGKPTITHVWYIFVHECLGEVARVVSLPDETDQSFTEAAEFRKLGF